MRRIRTAAATHDVQQTLVQQRLDCCGERLCGLAVVAQTVRKSGIGIEYGGAGRDGRQPSQMRNQRLRSGAAVESYSRGSEILDNGQDGLGSMSRQQASGGIAEGHGDNHGNIKTAFVHGVADSRQLGLDVQGVEAGFQQQQVHAAVDQRPGLFGGVAPQRVEINGTACGVLHIVRQRRRGCGWAYGSGHETRP